MTLSDSRNKARALSRIKRLASSGLPLDPFVRAIFELLNDAVPSSPNRTFHVGGERTDAYICNSAELNKVVPLHNRYYVESPPEISGAKFRVNPAVLNKLFPSKAIWMHDEVTLPILYRTEGYNVVFKPWGFHHCLMVMFQDAGELLGCYPIWRGADQKQFSHDDMDFVRSAAPHVAHGLGVGRLLERAEPAGNDFLPMPGWNGGVILLDARGHPVALDAEARLIFQQLGMLDRDSVDALASSTVRDGLAYVTRMLSDIFRGGESDSERAAAPVYRIYHHWTGIVLRLRGVRMMAADGNECTTVLVERGETANARCMRASARWGLSRREAQILSFIGDGKTGPEIALILAISHDTVRKHTGKVLEKLGVETRTAAAMLSRKPDDA
jgi:DNA-binding CsgD family transcriptional regulator